MWRSTHRTGYLIKGRGLDAELGGQLHVTGTAQNPHVDGGFELQRGTFTLVNSKLKFTNGTRDLQRHRPATEDLIHRWISLHRRRPPRCMATVHITGLADAPQLALSSSPELPQDEILARLLFGDSLLHS